MKKALIIGASSGIGRDLAIVLANNGYEVGLMARRIEMLEDLQRELSSKSYIGHVDLSEQSEAIEKAKKMIDTMDDVDLIVINSGVGFINPELDWKQEKQTIDVNVSGFCALAGLSYKYFSERGKGHLVGISSIAALRGGEAAPAYNASKAFISNYMEGLRKKAFKEGVPIAVTDIRPGWVDTEMAKGRDKFWVATPREAAEQIYEAIHKEKERAYITKRWNLIAWFLKLLPSWAFKRI
jgi:short-subunit dehydrogenase